jgi:hypothetical protein
MSLNPNKSAITQIEVSMREIDRVYDLTGFNALALGPDGKPELLTRQPDFSVFRANPFNFLNDAGEEVSRPARLKPVPGVYRSVRLEGYAPFLRTFARSESQKIDRKFVYVWSADSSRASVVELEHELYFENGDFRVVPFASPANKGKDIRPPEGERRSRLLLDVVSFWGGSQEKESYYFYLAPYQLPWQSLEAMKKRLPLRAMRLWDWFYTDVYTDGNPDSAQPLNQILKNGQPPAKMMFAMHLVDPFKEAVIRSGRTRQRLNSWMEEMERLSASSTYRLAKRIQNFVHANPDLAKNITDSLRQFIHTTERASARLLFASESAGEDLVRWIGLENQNDAFFRDGQRFFTLFDDGSGKASAVRDEKFPTDWHAPFSEALDDYQAAADSNPSAWEDLCGLVYSIHCGIDPLHAGKEYLRKTFHRYIVEGKNPLAHGGQSILFAAARKGHGAALNFQVGLLEHQASNWVTHYKKEAITTLEDWIRRTHGIELKHAGNRAERRALAAIERRKFRKARRAGLTGETVEIIVSPNVTRLAIAKTGMEIAAIGIEAVNLAYAYDDLKSNPGFQTVLNASGALLDAYAAVQTNARLVGVKLWDPKLRLYGTKSLRFSPLAVASAGIDMVLAGADTISGRTTDETVVHGLRTVGAAMTLGGTVFAETGVGVVVAVVGLGLQSLGTFIVANVSASSKFLRYSKWGTGPGLLDLGDSRDEYWYSGRLSSLADDIAGQHRALDNLYYDYQLEITSEWTTGSVMGSWTTILGRIVASENSPLALSGSEATWTIKAQVTRPDESIMPIVDVDLPDDYQTDYDITIGSKFVIAVFPWEESDPTKRYKTAYGTVEVRLRAKLDFFSDGATIVERDASETFRLYLRPPS